MPTEKRQRQKEGQRARREAALAELHRRQRRRRFKIFAVMAVLVLGLMAAISALTGDDKGSDDVASRSKPKVTVPKGAPPKKLVIDDLIKGKGATVRMGDRIEVNYVGVQYVDGKEFDSTYGGEPQGYTLTEGGLIDGWTQGIPGMKVGGRRRLLVPADLAYGDEDLGNGRPHGALIFVIDVISATPA